MSSKHSKPPTSRRSRASFDESAKQKKPFWQKRKVWLASSGTVIVTGVATGVGINLLTAQAQRIGAPPAPTYTLAPPPHSPVSQQGGRKPPHSPSNIQTGPPLTVVSEDPINAGDHQLWSFPDAQSIGLAQITKVNHLVSSMTDSDAISSFLSIYQIFSSHGGYQPNTDTQLVVQNDRRHVVRIINLRVVKDCTRPVTGELIYSPSAGSDNDIRLGFDLDSDDTEAETAQGWDTFSWKPDYFANHTVSIPPGDQQVFNIRTVVTKYACTFRFQAEVLDGKKKSFQLISNGDQPFRASAKAKSFSDYGTIYAGGVASPAGDDTYQRVDPKTYTGH